MNQVEFAKWWDDFTARFASIAQTQDSRDTLETWFQVLQGSTLASALEVTKRVQAGESIWPNDWAMIPAHVRDQAERIEVNWRLAASRREPDLDDARVCAMCEGSGVVLVYVNEQVKQFAAGNPPRAWQRGGVPCTCRRGDHHAAWASGKVVREVKRYDPDGWCQYDLRGHHEQTVRQWLEQRKPKNRDVFDEWNATV